MSILGVLNKFAAYQTVIPFTCCSVVNENKVFICCLIVIALNGLCLCFAMAMRQEKVLVVIGSLFE